MNSIVTAKLIIESVRKWRKAKPLLRRLANEAYMRLDYRTNAEICALLGEPSALEHEREDLKKST